MWTIIEQIVQGLISGVVGPVFSYLGKKQDTTLAGFQTAAGVDQANYAQWLDYQMKIETLKLSANAWWGPRLLYIIVGATAAIHTAAILLDSTFQFGWCVPKVPAPYDSYESMVIASLFVVSLASGPVSAISAWLHRK